MDVARKVIILARECGLPLELDSLDVHSLVPAPLADLTSPQDFLTKLPQVSPQGKGGMLWDCWLRFQRGGCGVGGGGGEGIPE